MVRFVYFLPTVAFGYSSSQNLRRERNAEGLSQQQRADSVMDLGSSITHDELDENLPQAQMKRSGPKLDSATSFFQMSDMPDTQNAAMMSGMMPDGSNLMPEGEFPQGEPYSAMQGSQQYVAQQSQQFANQQQQQFAGQELPGQQFTNEQMVSLGQQPSNGGNDMSSLLPPIGGLDMNSVSGASAARVGTASPYAYESAMPMSASQISGMPNTFPNMGAINMMGTSMMPPVPPLNVDLTPDLQSQLNVDQAIEQQPLPGSVQMQQQMQDGQALSMLQESALMGQKAENSMRAMELGQDAEDSQVHFDVKSAIARANAKKRHDFIGANSLSQVSETPTPASSAQNKEGGTTEAPDSSETPTTDNPPDTMASASDLLSKFQEVKAREKANEYLNKIGLAAVEGAKHAGQGLAWDKTGELKKILKGVSVTNESGGRSFYGFSGDENDSNMVGGGANGEEEQKNALMTLDANAKVQTQEIMKLAANLKEELLALTRATRKVISHGQRGLEMEKTPLEEIEDHVLDHYDQLESMAGRTGNDPKQLPAFASLADILGQDNPLIKDTNLKENNNGDRNMAIDNKMNTDFLGGRSMSALEIGSALEDVQSQSEVENKAASPIDRTTKELFKKEKRNGIFEPTSMLQVRDSNRHSIRSHHHITRSQAPGIPSNDDYMAMMEVNQYGGVDPVNRGESPHAGDYAVPLQQKAGMIPGIPSQHGQTRYSNASTAPKLPAAGEAGAPTKENAGGKLIGAPDAVKNFYGQGGIDGAGNATGDPPGAESLRKLAAMNRALGIGATNRNLIGGAGGAVPEFYRDILMQQVQSEKMIEHISELVKAYDMLWRVIIAHIPSKSTGAGHPILNGIVGGQSSMNSPPGFGPLYNGPNNVGNYGGFYGSGVNSRMSNDQSEITSTYFVGSGSDIRIGFTPFSSGLMFGGILVFFLVWCMRSDDNDGRKTRRQGTNRSRSGKSRGSKDLDEEEEPAKIGVTSATADEEEEAAASKRGASSKAASGAVTAMQASEAGAKRGPQTGEAPEKKSPAAEAGAAEEPLDKIKDGEADQKQTEVIEV